jgi:hypothetical protein
MKPVNNKSVLAHIFDQMNKLDKGEIDVATAKAQAELSKQVNNALKYELDRANTLMKLAKHNAEYRQNIELRNAESKNFDNV